MTVFSVKCEVCQDSFDHSLVDLTAASEFVGIWMMLSVCFRCANLSAPALSLAVTILAGKLVCKLPACVFVCALAAHFVSRHHIVPHHYHACSRQGNVI